MDPSIETGPLFHSHVHGRCISQLMWLLYVLAAALVLSIRWRKGSLFVGDVAYAKGPDRIDSIIIDQNQTVGRYFDYTSKKELEERARRFPSVDERVKLYMSDWYVPPCEDNTDGYIQYQILRDYENGTSSTPHFLIREIEGDGPYRRIFMVRSTRSPRAPHLSVFNADRREYIKRTCPTRSMTQYCNDTIRYVFPALDRVGVSKTFPILIQYGDQSVSKADLYQGEVAQYPNVPVIKKFRPALTKMERHMTLEKCYKGRRELPRGSDHFYPIVWKIRVKRHFGALDKVRIVDIPWSEKKYAAVFRGSATGANSRSSKTSASDMTDKEKCVLQSRRCRLVYNNANSTLVDAKFSSEPNEIPAIVDGINLVGKGMSLEEQLQYKAIIMIEGNDVSSGFKWALYSNSVVMTQVPTKTSWAMEELLEPWVHYIPLNDNLTDVEEKMQWVIDHDEEAQRIAHRGSLWIKDLILHPDVEKDDQQIFDEMARRYHSRFVRVSDLA